MSKIILQQLDFSTLGFPTNQFILGVDVLDGLPKLRTPSDTIILGLTGSTYLKYEEVTYSQFVNLINTSSLTPGGIYLLTDFQTKHYIQYTDSNGNGTANDEAIQTGSTEELFITAISENTYSRRVVSVQFPSDEIHWKHNPSNREKDHAISGSKGLIYFRKSANNNQRDYDFRNVVFRRWNDGSGNYTIFRAVDSPGWPSGLLLLDFIDYKSFEEGFEIIKDNKIGSMSDVPNVLSVPYYMDNFVFSTFSQAYDNEINESHGVTIDALDFTGNKISLLGNTNFINQSSAFNYNVINYINNSNFNDSFQYNKGNYISNSTIGLGRDNLFTQLISCSFSYFNNNNLLTELTSITEATYSYRLVKDAGSFSSQNYIDISNNLGKVFYLSSDTYPSLSIGTDSTNFLLNVSNYSEEFLSISNEGTFSFNVEKMDISLSSTISNFTLNGFTSSIFNIDYNGTVSLVTPSSSTSSNFLVLEDNKLSLRDFNVNYNVYDVNVMTYSATVSNYGKDYFGVGYTSSSVTFNLPSLSTIIDGKVVTIKDETGLASVNPITINTNGSDTLDGLTQSQLSINYGSLSFIKKSNGWWFI